MTFSPLDPIDLFLSARRKMTEEDRQHTLLQQKNQFEPSDLGYHLVGFDHVIIYPLGCMRICKYLCIGITIFLLLQYQMQ